MDVIFQPDGTLPDYYSILGLPENATLQAIESTYWKLAFTAKRDDLELLNTAYEVLASDEQRRAYDQHRMLTGESGTNPSEEFPTPRSETGRISRNGSMPPLSRA